jgi:hypothetical protein
MTSTEGTPQQWKRANHWTPPLGESKVGWTQHLCVEWHRGDGSLTPLSQMTQKRRPLCRITRRQREPPPLCRTTRRRETQHRNVEWQGGKGSPPPMCQTTWRREIQHRNVKRHGDNGSPPPVSNDVKAREIPTPTKCSAEMSKDERPAKSPPSFEQGTKNRMDIRAEPPGSAPGILFLYIINLFCTLTQPKEG